MSAETQAMLIEKATRYRQAQEQPPHDWGTMRDMMKAILAMPVSEFNELCAACGLEPVELEPIEPLDLSDILLECGIPQE